MAVTQKNVIEDVIIGTYKDQITPGLSKSTAAIKKQMDSVSAGAKAMAGGLLALFSFRELKQGFRELTEFAKTHYTQATQLVRMLDTAWNRLMTVIVNSQTFKNVIDKAIGALDIASVMLNNKKSLELFGSMVSTSVKYWTMVISNMLMNIMDTLFHKYNLFMIAINGVLDWIGKEPIELRIFEQPYDDIAVFKAFNESVQAMNDFEKFVNKNKPSASSLINAAQINAAQKDMTPLPMSAQYGMDDRKRYEKQIELEKFRTEMTKFYANQRMEISNTEKNVIQENLDELGWAVINNEMVNVGALERMAQAQAEWKDQFLNGFVGAMVAGFQAIGQSIVQGGNVLKAFVANFLSAIGQMAVQFGTMMILYGIAGQAVPFLGIQGAAAIAAGAALVVFGSALTALAGTMQKTANTSSNYRPESNFQESGSNKTTTVQVIIQALDPSTVSADVARNLGKIAYDEITKIEYLGRSPRFS